MAGRIVNGYNIKDFVLAYIYKCCNLSFTVAGLQPLMFNDKIENVELSDICDGHFDYFNEIKLEKIFNKIDVENYEFLDVNYYERKIKKFKVKIFYYNSKINVNIKFF